MHKSGVEFINNEKVFLDRVTISTTLLPDGYTAPSSNINRYLTFSGSLAGGGSNNVYTHLQAHNAPTWRAIRFMLRAYGDNTTVDTSLTSCGFIYSAEDTNGGYSWRPFQSNIELGANITSGKWAQIWCAQSSINSTSDERQKQSIQEIPDNILDAWEDIKWIQFKWNESVDEKGSENARLHSGLIAQHIDNVFKNHNLDITKYGLYLYDKWNGDDETPAGDSYGLRYTEALCMEAAYQRRENRRLKEKVASLEERLASLEEKLK